MKFSPSIVAIPGNLPILEHAVLIIFRGHQAGLYLPRLSGKNPKNAKGLSLRH